MSSKVPHQLDRNILQYVHVGNLTDIEQTILAVENLISRDKKFVLDFDSIEDLKFVFKPKFSVHGHDTWNVSMIQLQFEPGDVQSLSIIGKAYPFLYQTPEQIQEQKKWIVFFIYDLLQQYNADPDLNHKLFTTSNANLTRNAFAQLLRTRRMMDKAHAPRWYREMKKLLPTIRSAMDE